MESKTIKPSGWYYGLTALMPVLGCLIAMVMAYQWFPGLPGDWQAKMSLRRSCWPSDRTWTGSSLASRQEPSLRLRLVWPCCLAQALSRLSL